MTIIQPSLVVTAFVQLTTIVALRDHKSPSHLMSIARANGERSGSLYAQTKIMDDIAGEFLKRFPRCGKHLAVYSLKIGMHLSWRHIGKIAGLHFGRCHYVFPKTIDRIEAIKKEKFPAVAPAPLNRPGFEDQDE